MYSVWAIMRDRCLATGSGFLAFGAKQWQRCSQAYSRVKRPYPGGFDHPMTRREAALILGVSENAANEKIKGAYRRMIVANHPDGGGSHYVASKINEAKDILMGKK